MSLHTDTHTLLKDEVPLIKTDAPFFEDNPKFGSKFDLNKLSKVEVAQKWDKYAPKWDIFIEKSNYTVVLNWVNETTKQLLPNHKSGNILDLACGNGRIARILRENGVTGQIQGAVEMLCQALRTRQYDGGVRLADLDDPLPFSSSDKFDLITCFGVLEMVKNIKSLFQNVHSLLRDSNSQFWFSLQYPLNTTTDNYCFYSFTYGIISEGKEQHSTSHLGVIAYTNQEARDLVESSCFEIITFHVASAAYYMPSPSGGEPQRVPYIFFTARPKNKE